MHLNLRPSEAWLKLRRWRPFFIFAALALIVYGQTLFFNYTYFDDQSLILEKQVILRSPSRLGYIFTNDVFFSNNDFYYRPLLNVSYAIDSWIGGSLPVIYHLTSIACHIIAVSLLFLFLIRLTGRRRLSFLLSLLFLVHPALASAIAWIPGRNDSLLAIFLLAACIFFLRFLDEARLKDYIGFIIFFLGSLLTKETALFLPVLLGFYFLSTSRGRLEKHDAGLLALGTGAAIGVWYFLRQFALGGGGNYSLIESLGNFWQTISAFLLQFGKLILPFRLSVLPILPDSILLFGILGLTGFLVALFLSREVSIRRALFGAGWLLLFLLPSFLRPNGQPDFLEHRLYVPMIGFLIMLSEIEWIKKLDLGKRSVRIGIVVLLLLFSVLTIIHSRPYRDRIPFWEKAVKEAPHSALAQRNLGAMYYLDNRQQEALAQYEKARFLNPTEPMVHNNIGIILKGMGKTDLAEAYLREELRLYPDYVDALDNLADIYFDRGDLTMAASLWDRALQLDPFDQDAISGLLKTEKKLR